MTILEVDKACYRLGRRGDQMMDEDAALAESGEHNGVSLDAPPIPPVSLMREPYLIDNPGHQFTIGWQDGRKVGRCFIVGRLNAMGYVKVTDRFPLTKDGWATAWAALVALDAEAAGSLHDLLHKQAAARSAREAEKERQAQMFRILAKAEKITVFPALGVQVLAGDDLVYTIGFTDKTAQANTSRPLGPLSGAQAMVTDGAQAWSPGRAMVMPIGLAALATKARADAAIVFPDGTVHSVPLDGNAAVRDAQLQVVKFNALAEAQAPAPARNDAEAATDHAARLRALRELRDADLITDKEYEAKRIDIINSI